MRYNCPNKPYIEREELLSIVASLSAKKRPPHFIYDTELKLFSGTKFPDKAMPVFCHAGGANICFDSKGKVYPCSKFVGNFNYEQNDLTEEFDGSVFKKLWHNFVEVRRHLCSTCWAYVVCPGICPAEFIDEKKQFNFNRQSLRCRRNLAEIENAAYLYVKMSNQTRN